jgi:transposase InsO family protein
MKEAEIEMIREQDKEKYPEAKPRIISDNGPQFVARDFKEFIRISGYDPRANVSVYPQSKIGTMAQISKKAPENQAPRRLLGSDGVEHGPTLFYVIAAAMRTEDFAFLVFGPRQHL